MLFRTNFTENTKQKSAVFGKKIGKSSFKHLLLPHYTGLRYAIKTLKPSLDIIYDVTIAYSGVKQNEYAESKYGLKDMFLRGKYPKIIDIHIRGLDVNEIPCDNDGEFEEWLYQVWREKDELLEKYYEHGTFYTKPESQSCVVNGLTLRKWEFLLSLSVPIATTIIILKFILGFVSQN